MITVRPAAERGRNQYGWLDTSFTFSFNNYYDPRHMGFRSLRVINDDIVAPASGFPKHPHRDMEILTWVLDGKLAHKDSIGNGETLGPGELQYMSAGTGIFHSEENPSLDESLRLIQIWILPEKNNVKPNYGQKDFNPQLDPGKLVQVASGNPLGEAVKIHQDASLYVGRFNPGQAAAHELAPGRHAWIQMAKGEIAVNGVPLKEGDGAAISGESKLEISASNAAEVLLFDLA